jgi:hypothetical protein
MRAFPGMCIYRFGLYSVVVGGLFDLEGAQTKAA